MKLSWRQHRQPNDPGRFDNRGLCVRFPPPRDFAGSMGCVQRVCFLNPGAGQPAHDLPKAITPIAHRKQSDLVVWTCLLPTARNRSCCRLGSERPFELVRGNQDVQFTAHGGRIPRPVIAVGDARTNLLCTRQRFFSTGMLERDLRVATEVPQRFARLLACGRTSSKCFQIFQALSFFKAVALYYRE